MLDRVIQVHYYYKTANPIECKTIVPNGNYLLIDEKVATATASNLAKLTRILFPFIFQCYRHFIHIAMFSLWVKVVYPTLRFFFPVDEQIEYYRK